MNEQAKDIITFSLSGISVFIATYAFIITNKNSRRFSKIEISNRLLAIRDKIDDGRQIMRDIYKLWLKQNGYKIEPAAILLADHKLEKKSFIEYYNKNYHSRPHNSEARIMGDSIYTYLHELDSLWKRHLNGEFTFEELFENFKNPIRLDKDLILLYLNAHWHEHDQLDNSIDKRFWSHIPEFVSKINSDKD